jgi:uncharacterized membrane protein
MFQMLEFACGIFAVIAIVLSLVAILGGYFAMHRKNFAIAMVGAIAGIFTIGFFIGTVLAIIALFVLLLSHKEFKKGSQEDKIPDRGPGGC